MNSQVIDNDSVDGCTKQRRQLLIQTQHVVSAFKVVKVSGYQIRLRRQILIPKRKSMDRGTRDVAHKQDIVRSKRENPCRP
jgi:hypothetical protein